MFIKIFENTFSGEDSRLQYPNFSNKKIHDPQNRIRVEFENLVQNLGVIRNAVRNMEKRTQIYIEKCGRYVE